MRPGLQPETDGGSQDRQGEGRTIAYVNLAALIFAGFLGSGEIAWFLQKHLTGMIALAGIVTRDSIILVDRIQLSLKRGRSLFDATVERRVIRLRPILLTAGALILGAVPILVDRSSPDWHGRSSSARIPKLFQWIRMRIGPA